MTRSGLRAKARAAQRSGSIHGRVEEGALGALAHVVVLRQRETSRIIKAFLDVVRRTRDALGDSRHASGA